MINPIDETARKLISDKLLELENYLQADVITYYGEIFDYGTVPELSDKIEAYYSVLADYVTKYQTRVFVHTRRFL